MNLFLPSDASDSEAQRRSTPIQLFSSILQLYSTTETKEVHLTMRLMMKLQSKSRVSVIDATITASHF